MDFFEVYKILKKDEKFELCSCEIHDEFLDQLDDDEIWIPTIWCLNGEVEERKFMNVYVSFWISDCPFHEDDKIILTFKN